MDVGGGLYMYDVVQCTRRKKVHVRYLISTWVLVEYCSVAWNPMVKKDIETLEKYKDALQSAYRDWKT